MISLKRRSENRLATFARALHCGLTVRTIEDSANWSQRALGSTVVPRFETGIPPGSETSVIFCAGWTSHLTTHAGECQECA